MLSNRANVFVHEAAKQHSREEGWYREKKPFHPFDRITLSFWVGRLFIMIL
ncbi:hypothetical protein [Fictibacillus sp. FJAT-27399]|uniref:hypothetical protein n=1 Tax=Fictibacillus sp. FJAT-27399 TaxID=1729689 RepID=UPI000A7192A1|nr:hypothetical protein [Fictibacillus sp. FJAT-27399]